jgi:hypothetical protein
MLLPSLSADCTCTVCTCCSIVFLRHFQGKQLVDTLLNPSCRGFDFRTSAAQAGRPSRNDVKRNQGIVATWGGCSIQRYLHENEECIVSSPLPKQAGVLPGTGRDFGEQKASSKQPDFQEVGSGTRICCIDFSSCFQGEVRADSACSFGWWLMAGTGLF